MNLNEPVDRGRLLELLLVEAGIKGSIAAAVADAGGHTHTITVNSRTWSFPQVPSKNTSAGWGGYRFESVPGVGRTMPVVNTETVGIITESSLDHNHGASASTVSAHAHGTSVSNTGAHTHSITFGLNNTGSQATFLTPSYGVNWFIYLGDHD